MNESDREWAIRLFGDEAIAALKRQDTEISSLKARVQELEKDKARLDWLERQELRQMEENNNRCDFLIWYPWFQTCWGDTYREAIDAAMQSKGSQ